MLIDREAFRTRLVRMLEAESGAPIDWAAVQALAMALAKDLANDDGSLCPPDVYRYIDDVDIRQRDSSYAIKQRDDLRRFLRHA